MGGDVADFVGQIPPAVILTFCGFMSLLVVSLALLVANIGRKRNANNRRRTSPPPPLETAPAGGTDLPDLDLLLGSASAAEVAANPSPLPQTPISRPRPATSYQLQLPDGRLVEAVDVMTIARDTGDGSYLIRMGDKVYGSVAEISDAEARRRFTSTLKELAEQAAKPPRPKSASPSPAEARPESPPQPSSVPPAPASESAKNGSVNVSSTPAGDWDLPNFQQMANEPIKLRGGRPKNPVPEINLAGAIEAYLQHKLSMTPEFAGRSLHVSSTPGGDVQIEVDGHYYEAVGDIEDERTRQFISQTIEEWQARQ